MFLFSCRGHGLDINDVEMAKSLVILYPHYPHAQGINKKKVYVCRHLFVMSPNYRLYVILIWLDSQKVCYSKCIKRELIQKKK
jgi:hypothetical protein